MIGEKKVDVWSRICVEMLGGQTMTLCLLTHDGGQGTQRTFSNYYLLSIIFKFGLINPIGKIISIINSDVIILFMMYVQLNRYVDFYTSGNLYFIDHCRSYL